ncbi:MAG: hypothetical protein M5R40_09470 [Anaerolineae bacterium]|nr:hypothetical protein [Anaerolineae bacterium]
MAAARAGGAPAYGPLTMDFLRQAYPYHAPEGVAFADGTTLLDYELEPGAPCPAFTVRAQWADAPALPEGRALAVELTLPAANSASVPVALGGGEAALVEGDAAEPVTVAPPCPLSPGVYLLTLRVVAQGESVPALTAAGEPRGALTLAPLVQTARLRPGASDTPAAEVMPGLQLLDAALQPGDAPYVLLRWRADAELPRNYHIGLRLRDVAGNLWAEQDAPMGLFGAYPPALWAPGELVRDFYALQIPPAMPPGSDYRLQISVYDAATGAVAGEVVVGDLRWAGHAPSDDAPGATA